MSQKQNTKDNKPPYGPERHSMYNALRLAWRDYYNLSKQQVLDKKIISHHKRVIRRLQDKLRKPITPFTILEGIIQAFCNLNPELFKENANNDLIEKAMIKTTAILA